MNKLTTRQTYFQFEEVAFSRKHVEKLIYLIVSKMHKKIVWIIGKNTFQKRESQKKNYASFCVDKVEWIPLHRMKERNTLDSF